MKTFEELLKRKKRGSLKVYLGYAAGVGKTYSMLREAHVLKARGFDVVIGYVEPHSRPDTSALVSGLEQIPTKSISVADKALPEMDVDAILLRKPQVVLIDELAHTNVVGAKNPKRFLDVMDILEADINVLTTLNVQHLESVADRVTSATRVPVYERLPDFVLQQADSVVVVDVTMEELRERLRLGKIYSKERAETALQNFFSYQNLSFLRETALREAAGDHARKAQQRELHSPEVSALAEEAVMVAMSSDPANAEVLIRKGSRMATQLSSPLYVIYVQKKAEKPTVIDSALQCKLQNNLELAKRVGAEVVTLVGENVSDILVNFAHEHSVGHAIFGKSRASPVMERLKGSILLDFIHDSVGIDVHVVNTESKGER